MFFERSTGRRFRLRATLAVMGLVGSSLALSLPARGEEFAHPEDDDPTELYVPKAGYNYNAPRPAGRLTPALRAAGQPTNASNSASRSSARRSSSTAVLTSRVSARVHRAVRRRDVIASRSSPAVSSRMTRRYRPDSP